MPFKSFVYRSRKRIGQLFCSGCQRKLKPGELVYSRYRSGHSGRKIRGHYCAKCYDFFYFDSDKLNSSTEKPIETCKFHIFAQEKRKNLIASA